MKIAISATGPNLDAEVDPRFGRCQYFIIADPETMVFEAVENSSAMTASGAGISAAQMVASKGVQAALTGNCGPNAYQTLSAAGIQVITEVSGGIRDVIEGYKSGRFKATSQPTAPSHSGMGGMGMGRGMGRGMGIGRGMEAGMMPMTGPATQSQNTQQELEAMKTQSKMMEQQLADIQRRIKNLEKKNK
jgi:predicted Fe-Mo cluster-binding NifX family protein